MRSPRIVAAALLLLAAGSAAAQPLMAVHDFIAPAGDASLTLLNQILGEPNAGQRSLFRTSLFVFNMAVLAFAAMLFGYTMIVGLLQSAHDGQLLGKTWSSIWVPFRFSLGVALLFPTSSGLNGAQNGLMWGVEQGVAVASTIWRSAVTTFEHTGSVYIAARSADTHDVRLAIAEVMKAEICTQYLQEFAMPEGHEAGRTITRGGETFIGKAASFFGRDFNGGRIEWGGLPGTGYRSDACGAVDIPNTYNLNPAIKDHAVADNFGHVQTEALIRAAEVITPFAKECTSLEATIARDHQPCPMSEYINILNQATAAYSGYIATHFYSTVRQQNDRLMQSVRRAAAEKGWLSAGSQHFQIARITGDLNLATSSVPTVHPMLLGHDFFSADTLLARHAESLYGKVDPTSAAVIRNQVDAVLEEASKRLNDATNQYASSSGSYGDKMSQIDTTAGGSLDRNRTTDGIRQVSHLFFGIDGDAATDSSRHFGFDPNNPAPALVQLKSIGDYIMGIGTTGFATLGLLDLGKGAIGKAGPKGMALKAFIEKSWVAKSISFGIMLFGVMMILGAILALWIPMLPFVIWLGQTMGWVLSVMEMLIAAPLWVAAHMHPDGDGVSSRYSASGYSIVVEIIARPSLMLLGLIAAMSLIDPILGYFSTEFYPHLATIIADAQAQPFTMLFKIGMFAVLTLMLTNTLFRAIVAVPNNVMRWIGGMTDNHNSMGTELNDATKTAIIAAGTHTVMRGGPAMRNLLARSGGGTPGGNTISPR